MNIKDAKETTENVIDSEKDMNSMTQETGDSVQMKTINVLQASAKKLQASQQQSVSCIESLEDIVIAL